MCLGGGILLLFGYAFACFTIASEWLKDEEMTLPLAAMGLVPISLVVGFLLFILG